MDDLIVKFCEDYRSWLFVIAGTLGLALVFVLPAVDDYAAVCEEKTDLTGQLAKAEKAAGQVRRYERKMEEKNAVVELARSKTVHQENRTEFRNAIVKMVRENGCQLRGWDIGNPVVRVWGEKDDPLARQPNKKTKSSGYQLEKRIAKLSLVGPSANVDRLLERFEQREEKVHVHGIELRPGRGNDRRVELSLELWYFTLARADA